MCGMAGVVGDLNTSHKDTFKDLLRVASLRGVHSTGVIGITQKNEYRWAKEVGEPAYLFDTRRYEEATFGPMSGLIGHTRHKTVGEVSRQTAHPFDYPEEGIVGVHNGTLKNYYKLTEGSTNGRVDSEILYEHLAKNGAQATFSTIEGAWACVWWDNNTNQVHFIRNDERPLWFAWTKDAKALFWASERWMLGAVERRMDLLTTEGLGKFIGLPINTLWSFSVTPNDKDTKVHFLGSEKIDPFTPKPVITYVKHTHTSGATNSTSSASGGSVPHPFQKSSQDSLDDPLPPSLQNEPVNAKGFIRPEKKTLTPNEVPFLGTSAKPKEESSAGQLLLPSAKPKASRRTLTSRLLGLTHKDESSSTSAGLRLTRLKGFVSTRLVAGTLYITDNKTGKEYSEAEFEEKTNALCNFCKGPVGDLEEVHEFLAENKFICKSCIEEPAIPCVIV